ncbi:dihydrofolate reductase [Rhodococcus sp. PvR044]|uniref:dihydrofolate reductase family protein n=1 Tax=unclassified Rhodococcus (in: high G+C Gram-positive bacteria) TaxID=192944 RepID=UPI000BDD54BE|nr:MULTISPECIES: dihydrofolate reductase family protein [unclassified Rhodococcus (in: high G+C Gram-positive bacteria)]MBP1161031.1 dihydrofolate reductase [Rhodococcus sp. PvR099]PTR39425.1 dihydrofolate reductase [Rhodococcus sp. OK611]SNX92576.1 Dihydrofolate reductase [Rhodococcus sp. OK270]
MKLTVTTFVTLDGVYQAPGGPEEDPSDGFVHGGWSAPYGDEDFGGFMIEVFDQADAFLLGRKTYEIFASYWPNHDDPADPIAGRLNRLPKHVASTTLAAADWQNSRLITGDTRRAVADLKAQDGRELQVHGSGALVQWLLREGLVDTLHLLSFPVLLGTGKRLFPTDSLPTAFALAQSRVTGRGVVISSYERSGEPEYGDLGEE